MKGQTVIQSTFWRKGNLGMSELEEGAASNTLSEQSRIPGRAAWRTVDWQPNHVQSATLGGQSLASIPDAEVHPGPYARTHAHKDVRMNRHSHAQTSTQTCVQAHMHVVTPMRTYARA